MKVVCANLGEDLGYETYNEEITIGKSYKVISQHKEFNFPISNRGFGSDNVITLYTIINDEGKIVKYNKRLFMSIEEWRNKRINVLGL